MYGLRFICLFNGCFGRSQEYFTCAVCRRINPVRIIGVRNRVQPCGAQGFEPGLSNRNRSGSLHSSEMGAVSDISQKDSVLMCHTGICSHISIYLKYKTCRKSSKIENQDKH